jgi:hypothetical protein
MLVGFRIGTFVMRIESARALEFHCAATGCTASLAAIPSIKL